MSIEEVDICRAEDLLKRLDESSNELTGRLNALDIELGRLNDELCILASAENQSELYKQEFLMEWQKRIADKEKEKSSTEQRMQAINAAIVACRKFIFSKQKGIHNNQ